MSRWKVVFRTCDTHWAAQFPDHFNFASVWDRVPWRDRLIERETTDEASARRQYEQLKRWAESHEQPIKDVALYRSDDPDWVPAEGGAPDAS